MNTYVDSSAWVKRYLDEEYSQECLDLMSHKPNWTTSRLALLEVHRALKIQAPTQLAKMRREFDTDLMKAHILEIDRATCAIATEIAVDSGARSLDAIHVASAFRAGANTSVLTYDKRMSEVAKRLGLNLVPVRQS